MIGQISASNQLRTSSELASVMEFGFKIASVDFEAARTEVLSDGLSAAPDVQPCGIEGRGERRRKNDCWRLPSMTVRASVVGMCNESF